MVCQKSQGQQKDILTYNYEDERMNILAPDVEIVGGVVSGWAQYDDQWTDWDIYSMVNAANIKDAILSNNHMTFNGTRLDLKVNTSSPMSFEANKATIPTSTNFNLWGKNLIGWATFTEQLTDWDDRRIVTAAQIKALFEAWSTNLQTIITNITLQIGTITDVLKPYAPKNEAGTVDVGTYCVSALSYTLNTEQTIVVTIVLTYQSALAKNITYDLVLTTTQGNTKSILGTYSLQNGWKWTPPVDCTVVAQSTASVFVLTVTIGNQQKWKEERPIMHILSSGICSAKTLEFESRIYALEHPTSGTPDAPTIPDETPPETEPGGAGDGGAGDGGYDGTVVPDPNAPTPPGVGA
jgi:hypothetical protein